MTPNYCFPKFGGRQACCDDRALALGGVRPKNSKDRALGLERAQHSPRTLGGVRRARFMTGGGYRLLASANFGELFLGCIEATFCK